ncbi:Asp-tRNA(Asn)/Glu-tRNA(Gln) amidotransferase subunit GatB [Candidatus Parcubacteria bacterium]|nr:Asp-tRNA(Asn)/Glu-tRNA(Gln) amidotransferase subunit GatB [Candidatus Parcubacteria bacterium]
MFYKPTIGLEIHVELKTKSKMFCSCPNNFEEQQPNINVCPICLGHPGTLPVINKEAIHKLLKIGLALHCHVPKHSKFDRKHYFYPDLPKGYQISQYDLPLCKNGYLEIFGKKENDPKRHLEKKVRINRVHMEEDTGRLIHSKGTDYSLVDCNRAGIPLMELVTEPDIDTAKQAQKFAKELQLILRYLDISSADMEKGQMRVEVNISLSEEGKPLGTKVEVKNLNSFKAVEGAIAYEIKRQTNVLEAGEKVIQETRGWVDDKKITVSQRIKEESHDYRYFPEPDLPALHFTKEEIDNIRNEISELPQEKHRRFLLEYDLGNKEAEIFVTNRELGNYFEKTMSELLNWINLEEMKAKIDTEDKLKLAKLCSNYMLSDLQNLIKNSSLSADKLLITPENFAEFTILIYEGKISSKIAKVLLQEMFKTGADPSHIIKEKELIQVTDESEIEKIIQAVIAKNPKPVADFQAGKENALKFLTGQVMAQSKGKAAPDIVAKILKQTLEKNSD